MGRTACTEPQCLYKSAIFISTVPNLSLRLQTIHVSSFIPPLTMTSEPCDTLVLVIH